MVDLRRLDDVREDNIVAVGFLLALGGFCLAGASFVAEDGLPWPVGVVGLGLLVVGVALLIARIREIWQ